MAASTFDALEASRKLKQAGIDEQHAEAIADQLRSAAGAKLDQLATKADLQQLAERSSRQGARSSPWWRTRTDSRWRRRFRTFSGSKRPCRRARRRALRSPTCGWKRIGPFAHGWSAAIRRLRGSRWFAGRR